MQRISTKDKESLDSIITVLMLDPIYKVSFKQKCFKPFALSNIMIFIPNGFYSHYASSVAFLGCTELAKYRILQEEQKTNTAPI